MVHDGKRLVSGFRRIGGGVRTFGRKGSPYAHRFAKASGRGLAIAGTSVGMGAKEAITQLRTGLNVQQAEHLRELEERELDQGLAPAEEKVLKKLRAKRELFIKERNRLLRKYHPFSVAAKRLRV